MKQISMFMLSLYLVCCVSGQLTAAENEPETLSGKPIMTVFSNYHAGFGTQKDDRGFELERAYLGYAFDYGSNFSGKVVYDIGTSKLKGSELERIGYVKNAYISYHNEKFTLNAGLISLEQANIQEKFWGRRYLMQSFQYEYKFGSSADMGLWAKYNFSDKFAIDATCINGEGYKKLNVDKGMRYGAGLTFKPNKNLTLRVYADNYDVPEQDTTGKSQNAIAFFAGWKNDIFSLGAEYNMLINKSYVEDHDLNGASVYADAKIAKGTSVFARWDNLSSKDDWSESSCGNLIIAGIEWKVNKHLVVTPNFRAWLSQSDSGTEKIFAYVNLHFSI